MTNYPNQDLLDRLAKDEYGGTVDDMMAAAVMDSVVPGICTKCNATVRDCEPDAERNWCPNCGENAVKSCLVLARWV